MNFAKPNLVLLFVGIADLFVAKMSSSETVAKREAILIAVPKQWIAKDIPSFTTADQNARKLLSTDLVNTNEKCYSSWFLLAWDHAPQWEERSN